VIKISSFGAKLISARERLGLDLDAVAEETKIRKHYLNALEQENFSVLPARVYATGFVGRYARLLNIDPELLVKEFQDVAYGAEKFEQEIILIKEKSPRKFKIPIKNIIAGLVFLVGVILIGNYLVDILVQRGISQQQIVAPDKVEQVKEAQKAPADKLLLNIIANQRCWLEVRVDGEVQYSSILEVGETLAFEGKQSITIRAGNAGGLDLSLNGKKLAPLGKAWEVVEKKFDLNSIAKE